MIALLLTTEFLHLTLFIFILWFSLELGLQPKFIAWLLPHHSQGCEFDCAVVQFVNPCSGSSWYAV